MTGIDRIAIHDLFGIEGLDVAWYGIIIAAGIVAGVCLAVWLARKKGCTAELIFDLMIIALPLAIVGARLYYVLGDWEYYSQHPELIVQVWTGGIAIYGAVIGAVGGAFIVAKWNKFPLGRLLDIGAPGLILGQAIGRWGNFVNKEAFGNPVTDPALQFFPYAVFVDQQYVEGAWHYNEWFQATFFYESMWNLGVLVLLLWYFKRAKRDGNVFAMYLVGYGLGRFWIEGLRLQTIQLAPGIPASQALSVVLMVVGVAYILMMRKRNGQNALYEGKYQIGWAEAHPEPKKNGKGGKAAAKGTAPRAAEKKEGAKAQAGVVKKPKPAEKDGEAEKSAPVKDADKAAAPRQKPQAGGVGAKATAEKKEGAKAQTGAAKKSQTAEKGGEAKKSAPVKDADKAAAPRKKPQADGAGQKKPVGAKTAPPEAEEKKDE